MYPTWLHCSRCGKKCCKDQQRRDGRRRSGTLSMQSTLSSASLHCKRLGMGPDLNSFAKEGTISAFAVRLQHTMVTPPVTKKVEHDQMRLST